ncbi:MAG: 4Fe-4S ferredoxin, partial [Actinobacteria bacterium]|nr:4Fe-4S ferredoxin [Actinomycetota bacterium]
AGVIDAVDVLRDINLGKKIDIGQRVAVIGGGNAAIDAVRTLNRLGREVHLLYRRTRNEMPAWSEEVDEAMAEGIDIQFLVAPVRVIAEKGKVKQLECIRMELGQTDKSGRARPVPLKGSEFIMDIDTLVPAISQEPEIKWITDGQDGFKLTKWNTIDVDVETMFTGQEGIFAGGDVVLGPKTVTEAMSHGKIAAQMIDKYIKGEEIKRDYKVTQPAADVDVFEMTEEEVENLRRYEMPMLAISERAGNFNETELGFSKIEAVCEAKHCLRCDKEEKE